MPGVTQTSTNITVDVIYNQIYTLPLTMPNNVLWIFIPFNWEGLTATAFPTLLNGNCTLVWEMASNGSVTSTGSRTLSPSQACSYNYPANGLSGSINVPIAMDALQPTTTAFVLNLTVSLALQIAAPGTSGSFSPTFSMVEQSPSNQVYNLVSSLASNGSVTAPSPVTLDGITNYPSTATASVTPPTTSPMIHTQTSGPAAGVGKGATTMTVTVPLTVTGANPANPPAINYLGVTFTLPLSFGAILK